LILTSSLSAFADEINVNPERVSFNMYQAGNGKVVVIALFDGSGNRISETKAHIGLYDNHIVQFCEIAKEKAAELKKQIYVRTGDAFFCRVSDYDISY
jgi:hypothetical protein